jgi:hypothetical protein
MGAPHAHNAEYKKSSPKNKGKRARMKMGQFQINRTERVKI